MLQYKVGVYGRFGGTVINCRGGVNEKKFLEGRDEIKSKKVSVDGEHY